ncbi:DNA recombinase, partial [mine drainage metagenome]
MMRVAIYARVSTEAQEARGTIGSQLEVLRKRVAAEGHQLIAEYCDDGCSGARLDRPGLDAVRDAAEAGQIEAVWCLSPDRLARVYAYQVIVLDELARCGVSVLFHDTPQLNNDPQTQLLQQVQGVIAEYERAKIAERYRRGKLWRSRAGEVIAWKCSYGYRRIPRTPGQPAHLEVYEPEAGVVRRIFADYVHHNVSVRQITRRLNDDGIPSPSGQDIWGCSTIGRLLRNEAYVGRVYFNRRESVASRKAKKGTRQVERPREQWIAIPVPPIVSDELFEAAQRVSRDNSKWSPRRTQAGHWLLRGLIKCGHCHVTVSCHKMRGRNGSVHRYYYCANHDPLRAKGEHRRCPERNIRADELDAFVFEQVRAALLRPQTLLAGQEAVATHRKPSGDELLEAELTRLDRKIDAVCAERRRVADLYQASFIEQHELLRRGKELDARRRTLETQRETLICERKELGQKNRLRQRIAGFAEEIIATIDTLDFEQRQRLLRLVVEQVRVQGWQVEIRLRIPLDGPPDPPDQRVSSKDRLRSLDG